MFCKKWKYQLVVVLRFRPNQFISQQDWKLMYGFQKNTMSEILMVIQIRLFTVCTVISVTEARPLI